MVIMNGYIHTTNKNFIANKHKKKKREKKDNKERNLHS